MNTYFVKCRKVAENIDPKMVRTKTDQLCNQNVLFVGLKNQHL